jgi:hypothetical protein
MTTLTEGRHAASFILSEAAGMRSRENITVAESQTLKVGQVLGAVAADTGTIAVGAAAAVAGNTGNGTVTAGSPTYNAGVKEGTYRAVAIEAGTDGGTFAVEDPDGVIVGTAKVGVAFNGPVKFTINDGSTDFAAGDAFTWAVTIGNPATLAQHKVLAPSATDGTQNAAAISIYDVTTGAGETVAASVIARDAEVNGKELEWPGGISADEKAAAIAQLAAAGIIVR